MAASSMKPLIVHHLNDSCSQRILWLLEELNVPYEVKKYQRNQETLLAPPELKDVHPLGKSPVVTDPNNNNRAIAETGFIIEYITSKYGHGKLVPVDSEQRSQMQYWLHYAEGSAMTPLVLRRIFSNVRNNPQAPFFIKPILRKIDDQVTARFIQPNLEIHRTYLENELAKNPSGWFVGNEISAADIILSFPIEAMKQRAGLTEKNGPKLIEWLNKIHQRPAYQKALEKGGEYAFAKQIKT